VRKPPQCGPTPDRKPFLKHAPRECFAKVQALAAEEPSREGSSSDGGQKPAAYEDISVQKHEVLTTGLDGGQVQDARPSETVVRLPDVPNATSEGISPLADDGSSLGPRAVVRTMTSKRGSCCSEIAASTASSASGHS